MIFLNKRRIIIAIQARMASVRFPGKVLTPIQKKPLLAFLIERLQTKFHNEIIVLTTKLIEDDPIVQCANKLNIFTYRGSENDVLSRYVNAIGNKAFNIIVRITADNPLTDPSIIEELITLIEKNQYDYAYSTNTPLGCGADAFTKNTLVKCNQSTQDPYHREHINGYILDNPNKFKIGSWSPKDKLNRPDIEVTIDTVKQFNYVNSLINQLKDPISAGINEIVIAADTISNRG